MDADFLPQDDALTDHFEAQLRPLVRAVRVAVEDQIFADPGDSSVGRILQFGFCNVEMPKINHHATHRKKDNSGQSEYDGNRTMLRSP